MSRNVKIIAYILVLVIGLNPLGYGAPATLLPSYQTQAELNSLTVALLPKDAAILDEIFEVPNGKSDNQKTIYLIQDAHTNASGQMNVAKILEHLFKSQRIPYVFLEGSSGDMSLSFLRDQVSLDKRKLVAQSYLNKGLLQGSEYLDLTSEYPFELWGVEDSDLYDDALELYRDVVKNRPVIQKTLHQLRSTLDVLKPHILNPALADWDRHLSDYTKGDLLIIKYLLYLYTQAQALNLDMNDFANIKQLILIQNLEASIDFANINHDTNLEPSSDERNTQNWEKYTEYKRNIEAIQHTKLLDEIQALENLIRERLTFNDDERRLLQIQAYIRVLEHLIELELTPDDYESMQTQVLNMDLDHMMGFLNKKIMDLKMYTHKALFINRQAEQVIKQAIRFYESTLQRDGALVSNLMDELTRTGASKAVLIAGGYHAPNLKRIFKDLGINFVSIIPQITHETNHQRYNKILLDQSVEKDSLQNTIQLRAVRQKNSPLSLRQLGEALDLPDYSLLDPRPNAKALEGIDSILGSRLGSIIDIYDPNLLQLVFDQIDPLLDSMGDLLSPTQSFSLLLEAYDKIKNDGLSMDVVKESIESRRPIFERRFKHLLYLPTQGFEIEVEQRDRYTRLRKNILDDIGIYRDPRHVFEISPQPAHDHIESIELLRLLIRLDLLPAEQNQGYFSMHVNMVNPLADDASVLPGPSNFKGASQEPWNLITLAQGLLTTSSARLRSGDVSTLTQRNTYTPNDENFFALRNETSMFVRTEYRIGDLNEDSLRQVYLLHAAASAYRMVDKPYLQHQILSELYQSFASDFKSILDKQHFDYSNPNVGGLLANGESELMPLYIDRFKQQYPQSIVDIDTLVQQHLLAIENVLEIDYLHGADELSAASRALGLSLGYIRGPKRSGDEVKQIARAYLDDGASRMAKPDSSKVKRRIESAEKLYEQQKLLESIAEFKSLLKEVGARKLKATTLQLYRMHYGLALALIDYAQLLPRQKINQEQFTIWVDEAQGQLEQSEAFLEDDADKMEDLIQIREGLSAIREEFEQIILNGGDLLESIVDLDASREQTVVELPAIGAVIPPEGEAEAQMPSVLDSTIEQRKQALKVAGIKSGKVSQIEREFSKLIREAGLETHYLSVRNLFIDWVSKNVFHIYPDAEKKAKALADQFSFVEEGVVVVDEEVVTPPSVAVTDSIPLDARGQLVQKLKELSSQFDKRYRALSPKSREHTKTLTYVFVGTPQGPKSLLEIASWSDVKYESEMAKSRRYAQKERNELNKSVIPALKDIHSVAKGALKPIVDDYKVALKELALMSSRMSAAGDVIAQGSGLEGARLILKEFGARVANAQHVQDGFELPIDVSGTIVFLKYSFEAGALGFDIEGLDALRTSVATVGELNRATRIIQSPEFLDIVHVLRRANEAAVREISYISQEPVIFDVWLDGLVGVGVLQSARLASLMGELSLMGEGINVVLRGSPPIVAQAMALGSRAHVFYTPEELSKAIQGESTTRRIQMMSLEDRQKHPELSGRFMIWDDPHDDAESGDVFVYRPGLRLMHNVAVLNQVSAESQDLLSIYTDFIKVTGQKLSVSEFIAFIQGELLMAQKFKITPVLRILVREAIRAYQLMSRMTAQAA